MRVGAAALTLAVSLGVVGLASAEESGNWFTRMFSSSAAEQAELAKKADVKIEQANLIDAAANLRAKQAKSDLDRRQEVCMKLIEIANATDDDDLRRKAEMLDRRALDLYYAAKNQDRTPGQAEADTKKGSR